MTDRRITIKHDGGEEVFVPLSVVKELEDALWDKKAEIYSLREQLNNTKIAYLLLNDEMEVERHG